MLVKQMLPRARERLAVIEVEASVREAAYLMSKPHTDLVVVCSHGDMVGVIYTRDALQNLLGEAENEDGLLRDYISGVGYW
jgi:CBS domain-containing protein